MALVDTVACAVTTAERTEARGCDSAGVASYGWLLVDHAIDNIVDGRGLEPGLVLIA